MKSKWNDELLIDILRMHSGLTVHEVTFPIDAIGIGDLVELERYTQRGSQSSVQTVLGIVTFQHSENVFEALFDEKRVAIHNVCNPGGHDVLRKVSDSAAQVGSKFIDVSASES